MRCLLLILALLAVAAPLLAAPSPAALELRDRGLAQLENEKPDQAAATYRELAKLLPRDPLPHANLAVALLRQQQYAEARRAIDTALALQPGRADLLAIRGDIEQWSGQLDAALDFYEKAAAAGRDDIELLFAAYQLGQTAGSPRGEALAAAMAPRLAALRPDNLVLVLQNGQRAIQAGDRAAASAAFLRVGELLWQVEGPAAKTYADLRAALEKGDLAAARVPALRLENVLKVSAMYRENLRELKSGILGLPLRRLLGEPLPTAFGPPQQGVTFRARQLDPTPLVGRTLVAADLDGDEKADIAWQNQRRFELRKGRERFASAETAAAPGLEILTPMDLDNDGALELLGQTAGLVHRWQGTTPVDTLGIPGALAVAAFDFDIEGDLDLATISGDGQLELYRNNLAGPLQSLGPRALPRPLPPAQALIAADLDRDGDQDLLVGHAGGLAWLDNLRLGRFRDRSAAAGLPAGKAVTAMAVGDLDQDGQPDLAFAAGKLELWRGRPGGRFERWPRPELDALPAPTSIALADLDNDGRPDLALGHSAGLSLLQQDAQGAFRPLAVEAWPAGRGATQLAVADLDDDGDLDLAAAGAQGLWLLDNEGGNRYGWLKVRLRGLAQGNSKNNLLGLGATLELRAGQAVFWREVDAEVSHLGLGRLGKAEVLRVVFTNGVPQNRIGIAGNERIVEQQQLKGSCPFLYAWDGAGFRFVTDLLWGAPIGLPAAPGVWVGSDPSELVRVDHLQSDGGFYRLRVTEELWEAAFFDHLRLWVVDHPDGVEVGSNLRIVPGAPPQPEAVLGVRDLRPMAGAWDGQGREVRAEVAERDEIYADGYQRSPYQGVAKPWSFTFDLGEAPGRPIRLWLEGWIFPADASLNLAVAQRPDYPYLPPSLEVETAEGWQTLMPDLGFPAGKTKVTVVDTPPLPTGATRLRITSSLWLHWDRLRWSSSPDDHAPVVQARLLPTAADLRFRGFSALVRQAPNAPHTYDYARTSVESPWLPFPGRYTRYGDVLPLLEEPDDHLAILAPGDEIDLAFDARHLPPPREGWRRTLFLESHGWDKDADRNTGEGERLEPLPFRAMRAYPYAEGDRYPSSLDAYRREWLTRVVGPPEPPSPR